MHSTLNLLFSLGKTTFSNMSILKISQPVNLGEGPFWDHRQNALYYVDIREHQVLRWDSETGKTEAKTFQGYTTFVIPCQSALNKLSISIDKEIRILDWEDGTTKTLAQVDRDFEFNRFNDAKCDSRGRLWAGTMNANIPASGDGSLYTFDEGPEVLTPRSTISKLGVSNGIEWTLDDRVMFFIDSIKQSVEAFDYDINTGNISNGRVVVDFTKLDNGYPDGMTRDAEGKLWVASYGSGRVIRIDPQTGQEIQDVKFPGRFTTSCCFGGKDFQDLFVTSANFVDSDAYFGPSTEADKYGHIYRVSGLGVKGLPANFYRG